MERRRINTQVCVGKGIHTYTHVEFKGPLSAGQQVLDYRSGAIQSAACSYLYLTADQTDSLKAPLIAPVMGLLKPGGFFHLFFFFIDFSSHDTNKKRPRSHQHSTGVPFFLFLLLSLWLFFSLSPSFHIPSVVVLISAVYLSRHPNVLPVHIINVVRP